MSKLNHRRPYLVYKDNMERVRNNISYYLDTPAPAAANVASAQTPTQTETLLLHMLEATEAYYDAFAARIERLINGGKRKHHQALQEHCDSTYEAMNTTMRSFIAHVVLEGLQNNMQVTKQDSKILKRISKDLGSLPEFAEAFTLQMQFVENVLLGKVEPPTNNPAPSI